MDEKYLNIVKEELSHYVDGKYTGRLVFTFNCRNGGIGNLTLEVKKDLTPDKNITDCK